MKKVIIFTICTVFALQSLSATTNYAPTQSEETEYIKLSDRKINHVEGDIPLDKPDVYFNSSTWSITLIDYAGCSYVINIFDPSGILDYSTDIFTSCSFELPSTLPSGTYTIEISTSWGNTYIGHFTII